MTWECAPEERKTNLPARPDDEFVRFRFVEEPRCFDVESARNLCTKLRSMGKSVVSVEFEVRGGFGPLRREGYNVVVLEGRPFTDQGGWASSGANDFTGKCPIGKVIDSLNPLKSAR
jgi:hypothetical protein